MRRSVAFCLILLVAFLSLSSTVGSEEPLERGVEGDTLAQKRSGWLFFPILFYSPETKTGFGAGVGYFFREPGSATASRPSTILSNFIYTQKKQIVTNLLADLYLKDEAYNLSGQFTYLKFPDKFYGIGNDTADDAEEDFTPEQMQILIKTQIRLLPGLYLGPLYEFYKSELLVIENEGLLASGDILGSEGGKASCLGVQANLDTRDNVYYPSKGGYHQLSASLFSDDLGGDYNFKRYIADLRQYVPVFSSHVLAFQAYGRSTNGDVPFQLLSRLGGSVMMRGYYEGRYRAYDALIFQTEYRFPAWRRFGLAVFAGIGDVSSKMTKLRMRDFKVSLGFGVRYLFVPEEKINLRFDFGFGKGTSGFYIDFTEAF